MKSSQLCRRSPAEPRRGWNSGRWHWGGGCNSASQGRGRGPGRGAGSWEGAGPGAERGAGVALPTGRGRSANGVQCWRGASASRHAGPRLPAFSQHSGAPGSGSAVPDWARSGWRPGPRVLSGAHPLCFSLCTGRQAGPPPPDALPPLLRRAGSPRTMEGNVAEALRRAPSPFLEPVCQASADSPCPSALEPSVLPGWGSAGPKWGGEAWHLYLSLRQEPGALG